MVIPTNYEGPLEMRVPEGYIDVTCFDDSKRKGIPGPQHQYYVMLDHIANVLKANGLEENQAVKLAHRILRVL